MRRNTFIN